MSQVIQRVLNGLFEVNSEEIDIVSVSSPDMAQGDWPSGGLELDDLE